MNGVAVVLEALQRGERHLSAEFLAMAWHHRQEHEVHHVATDLAHWSAEHGRLLAEALDHYGPPDDHYGPTDPAPSLSAAQDGADAPGPDDPGLRLLEDLRALHLAVAGNGAYWQMLSQAASATRDARLDALVSHCRPRGQRQLRWTESMIKNLSAQILTAS
ncbi:hypothetical protein [Streptomyces sp. NPDC053431]|uniref:hypothetical protein n=1 Tax=Streptomyces sp. NPDC053431 TaxID=3365703 RepID=UPI0037CD10B5